MAATAADTGKICCLHTPTHGSTVHLQNTYHLVFPQSLYDCLPSIIQASFVHVCRQVPHEVCHTQGGIWWDWCPMLLKRLQGCSSSHRRQGAAAWEKLAAWGCSRAWQAAGAAGRAQRSVRG